MSSFEEQWSPTWVVMPTIVGAKAVLIENTGRTFRSGRAIIEAVFYDGARTELARRQGMTLTSKAGKEYVVCRREADQPATAAAATVEDVFDEL